MSAPWPPGPATPRSGHGALIRTLVVVGVALLVGAYAVLAYSTRDRWTGAAPAEDATSVVFTAAAPDGSTPSSGDLDRTRQVLERRIADLRGGSVSVDGDTVTVSATGAGDTELRDVGQSGRLYLRPVLSSVPGRGSASAGPDPGAPAQRVADEKALRQSTDQQVQLLALQFQTTRCGDPGALAGKDDPELPLVTCAQDGQTVYLLAPSILDGDEIASASTGSDSGPAPVVDIEFTSEGKDTWADFTARNIGTQIAFSLETTVISAPEIREAIPDGRTQVSGRFDETQARELAGVLGNGVLPLDLTFESSSTGPAPALVPSTPLRAALAAGGSLLIVMMIGTVVYLVAASRRSTN